MMIIILSNRNFNINTRVIFLMNENKVYLLNYIATVFANLIIILITQRGRKYFELWSVEKHRFAQDLRLADTVLFQSVSFAKIVIIRTVAAGVWLNTRTRRPAPPEVCEAGEQDGRNRVPIRHVFRHGLLEFVKKKKRSIFSGIKMCQLCV